MAGVGGAGGGGSKGGSSAGRAGGSRGGSKAGGNKAGKAGKTGKSAKAGAKADAAKAKATKDAAKAKAAAEVKSELAKDRVSTDKSQQQAEKAVKATQKSANEQQSRQKAVENAAAAARTADPIAAAAQKGEAIGKAADVAAALSKNGAMKGIGALGTAIDKAVKTGGNIADAVNAASKGDTTAALNSGTEAVVNGVQGLAAAANSPLGKALKMGSRFGGPAAAFGAAVDTAKFSDSLKTAVNQGGLGNWAQAGWDGAKAGLSTASMVPAAGAIPGAIAGAMDLGEMAYSGISNWLGS